MKNLKYLILVFTMTLLFGCAFGDGSKTQAENNVIYVSEITCEQTHFNVFVDDVIKLEDIGVKFKPANATVKPNFSLSNSNVAVIENNTIKFLNEGSVVITVSVLSDVNTYKTLSLTFVVSNNIVFATDVFIKSDSVTLNFDETAKNDLTILPSNYNGNVDVSYLNGNIVSYNYVTGTITPINVGTDTVLVKVYAENGNVISKTFKVEVTNNVYATKIADVMLNGLTVPDEITLNVGDKAEILTTIEPNNYNMGITYETSNSLISVNDNNVLICGDVAGSSELKIKVKSKNSEIIKTVKINIVNVPDALEFNIINDSNETINNGFVNTNYKLVVLSTLSDYSKLTIENCEFEYLGNNEFKIKFLNAGNTNVKISHNFKSFISDKVVTGNSDFMVYNPIEDVNFSLFAFNEILPTENNTYTIYLPNPSYYDEALLNNECVFANIELSAKGIYTKPDSLSVKFVGDCAELKNNKLTPKQIGTGKLIISSSDGFGFEKEVIINVEPLKVTNIIADEKLTLYLNGGSLKPNSKTLEFEVEPHYAYSTNVDIQYSSNVIKVENGIVYGLKEGNANITLSSGDIKKVISIEVKYVPTSICAFVNNEKISENSELMFYVSNMVYINFDVYSNNTKLDVAPAIYINDNLDGYATFKKFTFKTEETINIVVAYENLKFSFSIKVLEKNPITSFSFNYENINVNTFFTSNIKLSYTLETQNELKPTTDVLTFTTNSSLVSVSNDVLYATEPGTYEVYALINNEVVDTLTVNVIYKEYFEINSLNDFKNIEENKNYIVLSNLDFSDFSEVNAKNFNAEIDFNNKTITNLSCTMFNELNKNAIVKNLIVCGDVGLSGNTTYNFIANKNYGTIENVIFNNFNVVVNNSSSDRVNLSLLVNENYGTINGVTFNNATISTEVEFSSYPSFVCSGVSNINSNLITNIKGNISFVGFTRAGGITIDNCGTISDVTLTVNFVCTQEKQQFAGLIYKSFSSINELNQTLNSNVSNINLTINCTLNEGEAQFGGLVWNNSKICGVNVNLHINFSGVEKQTDVYLLFYKNDDINYAENFENLIVSSNKNFPYTEQN